MVTVKNLSAGYEKDVILKNISFDIKNGEFAGLIGSNGSGKSTLIKSFFRIADVYSGSIFVDNHDITKMRFDEIARLISVQRPIIKNNIQLPIKSFITAGIKNPDSNKLFEIIREFELTEIIERSISELSDGQLQRVSLAQAAYREPKVYLLDEPTSHLDLRYKIQMLSGLKKRIKDNVCVLAVIHEIELAKKFCNKVILMKDGKIKNIGDVDILYNEQIISDIFGLEVE